METKAINLVFINTDKDTVNGGQAADSTLHVL